MSRSILENVRRYDIDGSNELDEDHLFLALRSTSVGLDLAADDVVDLEYEIPPAPV